MKEMNYVNTRIKEILYEDDYLGYHFLIVSYGIHPCAYIEIPKTHRWYKKPYTDEELEDIECHGGLTYSDNLSHILGKEEANGRWFIGWDYGHIGDFEGYYLDKIWPGEKDFSAEKKWTTQEIFNEVKNVIEQIIKMDEGDGLEELENIGFCPIAYDFIEKKLKRLKELEKVLEIIKRKRVHVYFFMICKTLEEYNDIASCVYKENVAKQRMLTQEEYDLLKNEIE